MLYANRRSNVAIDALRNLIGKRASRASESTSPDDLMGRIDRREPVAIVIALLRAVRRLREDVVRHHAEADAAGERLSLDYAATVFPSSTGSPAKCALAQIVAVLGALSHIRESELDAYVLTGSTPMSTPSMICGGLPQLLVRTTRKLLLSRRASTTRRSTAPSRPCGTGPSDRRDALNKTALAMVFKLVEGAQKSWGRLDGHNQSPKIIEGVKFIDGLEAAAEPAGPQAQIAAA